MISEQFKILINKYLDGEITPDEKILLDMKVAVDNETRKYFDDMLLLDERLKSEAKNTHQIDLTTKILLKINTLNHSAVKNTNQQSILTSGILKSSRLRIAIAFISGAAACFIILFSVFDFADNSKGLSADGFSGSMVPSANLSEATKIITSPQATVEIYQSKLREGFFQLEVHQNSDELINVEFSFDAGNFQVYGLRPVEQGMNSSIGATMNSVIIRSSGNARFVFLLKQMNQLPGNVTIKVYSESGMLLNNDNLQF